MYKYSCNTCESQFNEPLENKEIKSKLIRWTILSCPYCSSNNLHLTEWGKLLVHRKAKINKIDESKRTNSKNSKSR